MAAADDDVSNPAGPEEQHSSDQPQQEQQQEQHMKKAKYLHQKDEEVEEDIDLDSSEDENSQDEETKETSEPLAQDAITLTLLAHSNSSSSSSSSSFSSSSSSASPSSGHGWTFKPDFTHQFFDEEVVPVGYPDLAINLSFNGTTAEWRLTITYDEAAGREEKKAAVAAAAAAAAAREEKIGREAVREKGGGGNDVSISTAAAPPAPPGPVVIASSNQGDDEVLLRCLLPVIPPLEGCSCTINQKEGWLLPDRGFVSEEEGREGGRGMSMAVLPFGEERARYMVSPRLPRKKEEEEEAEVEGEEEEIKVEEPTQPYEFAIHHARLNTYGLPDSSVSSSSVSSSSSSSSLPSSPRALANFHRRVQKLAPWFIENGDDVDPEGGEWEVLYLLALPPSLPASHEPAEGAMASPPKIPPATAPFLVGYLTLFAFTNPLKGKALRLCQALILPPFQRQGHGQRLLREGWRIGRERGVVYELNVEDPAPGFALLRNVTDVQDVKRWREGGKEGGRDGGWVEGKFEGLTAGEIKTVQRDLKITKAQVVLAYECLKLLEAPPPPLLPVSSQKGGEERGWREGIEARHRLFRLMVKRRMAREVEGEYEGRREELQAYLEKTWKERARVLEDVCRRAGMWEGGREGGREGENWRE
ncbi:histone acetyltransferase [Nannochloropsis oceanica]